MPQYHFQLTRLAPPRGRCDAIGAVTIAGEVTADDPLVAERTVIDLCSPPGLWSIGLRDFGNCWVLSHRVRVSPRETTDP